MYLYIYIYIYIYVYTHTHTHTHTARKPFHRDTILHSGEWRHTSNDAFARGLESVLDTHKRNAQVYL